MKIKDLLEQRGRHVADMRKITENPEGDGGDLSDDQAKRFDTLKAELDGIEQKIERQEFIDGAERRMNGTTIAGSGDTHLASEIRQNFSALRAAAGAAGLPVDWGFEREVQTDLAKRAGKAADGIYIPTEIFEKRVVTSGGSGANIIDTEHHPEMFINALTKTPVVARMGAATLSGLTGNVDIPRETGSPVIGWVAENAALSTGDATFDKVTLSPKHAGVLSEYSRNMLLQSSPDVEMLFRRLLARDIGLAVDSAAIQGGGTNEPDGVLSTTGIQTYAYASSLHDSVAEAIALAAIANVDASRSILTSFGVRKTAMKTLDTTGLPIGVPVIFNNEPTAFSNQVPTNLGVGTDEHGLIYGDWSELLIGLWSQLDILVNPYESTAYSKGNVSIRAMATVDMAVRHPAAFVSVTGVTVP